MAVRMFGDCRQSLVFDLKLLNHTGMLSFSGLRVFIIVYTYQ